MSQLQTTLSDRAYRWKNNDGGWEIGRLVTVVWPWSCLRFRLQDNLQLVMPTFSRTPVFVPMSELEEVPMREEWEAAK
jgi:hypothetical protein